MKPRPDNEETLKQAVATIGPIAVSIQADLPTLHSYEAGIYFDSNCFTRATSHAVSVAGEERQNVKFPMRFRLSARRCWWSATALTVATIIGW